MSTEFENIIKSAIDDFAQQHNLFSLPNAEQYVTEARGIVVEAAQGAVEHAVDTLRQGAEGLGLDDEQVERVLIDAGLVAEPVEEESWYDAAEHEGAVSREEFLDLASAVSSLTSAVDRIVVSARRLGVSL